jgi:hypothetical protein
MAIFLLPYFATRKPETGKLTINPTGRDNNTPPKAASFNPSFACTCGILDAQLAKQKPAQKNKTLVAIRAARAGEFCAIYDNIQMKI